MDRTLVICKPDAVERGLVGEIVSRFERRNLVLVAAELRTIDAETAGRHYAEHVDKPFYGELVEFIGRSPRWSWWSRVRRTPGRWSAP